MSLLVVFETFCGVPSALPLEVRMAGLRGRLKQGQACTDNFGLGHRKSDAEGCCSLIDERWRTRC